MRRLLITNEHGAWVILLTPIASVFLNEGTFSVGELVFVLAALAWFLVYKPFEIIFNDYSKSIRLTKRSEEARYWLPRYLAAAVLLSALVLYISKTFLLIPAGIFLLLLFLLSKYFFSNSGYAVVRNFIGVIILTSGSFLSDIFLHSSVTEQGLLLGFLNLTFFSISSFFVEFKIRKLKDVRGWSRNAIGFFLILIVLLFMGIYSLSLKGYIHFFPAIFAFIPLLLHIALDQVSQKRDNNFKKLGLQLLLYSAVFVIAISYAVQ